MEDRWIEDQVRDADKERIEAEKLAEARREREEIESRTMPFPPPTPSSPFGPELATPLPPTSPNSVPASLPAASQPSQTLASLTPNLRTFICSASLSATHDQVLTFNGLDAFNDQVDAFDALEWDWTHPDWIAPHPLLPSHPNVRMIGIRDIGERVRADWEERDERDGWDQSQFGFHDHNEGGHNPFFTLYLQLSSLLLPSTDDSGPDVPGPSTRRERQKVPFPSLKYIRDLDPDSDLLRRGVRHLGRNRMPSASRPTQRAGSSMVQNQGRRWSWRRPSLPSLPSFLPSSPFATMSPREFSRGSIPFFTSNPPRSFLYSVQTEPRSGERHDNNALDASHAALLTLWSRVLSATRGGGVWLEDWRGWNLTRGNLERWRMC
ncbi:hypothetical protein EV361DRAFT_171220 [Lentinula raphanica]|nr:hypothetical protein EV361DRAFT_171220 [Lentinula raphanica]